MKGATEYQHQVAIFEWASYQEKAFPMLKYMYATLNGIKLPIGLAVKAKKQGNKRGVPDIVLPYNNGEFCGLYIELKVEKGKASKEQKDYIEFLKMNGYKALVVFGYDSAIEEIKEYVSRNRNGKGI